MRTIDATLSRDDSRWNRTKRDVRLMLRLARQVAQHFIKGTQVRRAYRAKAARGEVYWLDASPPRTPTRNRPSE